MNFITLLSFEPQEINTIFTKTTDINLLKKHIRIKQSCIIDNESDFDLISDSVKNVNVFIKKDNYLNEIVRPKFLHYLKTKIDTWDKEKSDICNHFSTYCVNANINREDIAMTMMLRLINVNPNPNYKKYKTIYNTLNDS